VTDTEVRTEAEVLAELAEVRAAIDRSEPELMGLYERRRQLYREGRNLEPKVTQKRLADTAGVTEAAVIAALRKPDTTPAP
jgi:K+/H+ antiporter YhaU regulatory subunit KhtT